MMVTIGAGLSGCHDQERHFDELRLAIAFMS